MACSYCYARRMYKRFKWDERLVFTPGVFNNCEKMKPGSKVFVGSTFELFGEWVQKWILRSIFNSARVFPELTFIFLTKCPQNLQKWSPFFANCWIGTSVTANGDLTRALTNMAGIEAPVRFLSIEPLLGQPGFSDHMRLKGIIDWIIIGSRTQPVQHPPREWVDEITIEADKSFIPVFIKEPMASHFNIQRQEFPAKKGGI